jgi:hypothetical protein
VVFIDGFRVIEQYEVCCFLVSCEALGVDDSAVATEIPLLM